MTEHTFEGRDEAIKTANANRTPRFFELDNLEAYVETRQYKGRTGFWEAAKPLWERAPLIADPIVATAIDSNCDLMLGTGEFPPVTVDADDDEDSDDQLNEKGRERLGQFLKCVVKESKLHAVCREVLSAAQGCKTGVAIFGVRGNKLSVTTTKAKWCEPEFDEDGAVTKLEIRYVFFDYTRTHRGVYKVTAKIYRRVIDGESDTTYNPAVALTDGTEPTSWSVKERLEHGLGFCPVIWYPLLKSVGMVNDIDGQAIHARALDEIEARDFSLSMRHRLALHSEPQPYETGVGPGSSPTETGRAEHVPASREGGVMAGGMQARESYIYGADGKLARKRGPTYVWQYSNQESKVGYLAPSPGAHEPLQADAADLKMRLAESLAVVFLDPDDFRSASEMSGKAQEQLRRRQYARCDRMRDDLWDAFIEPALSMLTRIALMRAETLKTKNIKGAAKLLANFDDYLPALSIKWPAYSPTDAIDDQLNVNTAIAAKDAGLITELSATRKVARVFGIDSPETELELAKGESDERAADLARITGELNAEDDDATPRAGRRPAQGDAEGGSGRAGASDKARD